MTLTDSHKEAMAQGRRQSRAINAYLQKLHEVKPRRGRRRTTESIKARLAEIDETLPKASLLRALSLNSERENLESELRSLQGDAGPSLGEVEDEFVMVAREYSVRKGISFAAWKDAGVPIDVLQRAGISKN